MKSKKSSKEKQVVIWTKLVHTYNKTKNEIKTSKRIKLYFKILIFLIRILLSVLIRKLFDFILG